MYERHFGFRTDPFSLNLDPAVFYRSRQHVMAETVLEYALESQAAFCLLSGEIGCGKSLLVSRLLSKLGDGVRVGLIEQTHGRLQSIQALVALALGIENRGASEAEIYATLMTSFQNEGAKGRRTLLIVDEAQNLSVETLEELRLLSNANSSNNLLQILLVGQPEFRARLSRPELLQFAQRISAQFHLLALESDETHSYIRHRLHLAGGNPSLFTPEAMDLVHARTRGVPRLINQLCHFALAQASSTDRMNIDADLMLQMPRDCWGGFALQSLPDSDRRPRNRDQIASSARPVATRNMLRSTSSMAAVLTLTLAGAAWWYLHKPQEIHGSKGPAVAMTSNDAAQAAASLPPAAVDPPAAVPVVDSVAAPAVVPEAAPAVMADAEAAALTEAASSIAAPAASRTGDAALNQGKPVVTLPVTRSARAVRSAWYVNRATARLNEGDTAGAERLMLQASAAGGETQDIDDLRGAIDAQKIELRLISVADQIEAAIASDALIEPAADSAVTRYREMLALNPGDPLTLRARRELHAALLAQAENAIHKDQFDAARGLLDVAADIGPSADAATAQVLGELNRMTQRAATAAAVPTAQSFNSTTGDVAADVVSNQAASKQ